MVNILACIESSKPVVDTMNFHAASLESLGAAMTADELTKMLLLAGWVPVAIIAIVAGSIAKVYRTRAREQSRREIAAYIAEGSMTPEQGERILNAGRSKKGGWCGDEA